MKKRFLGGMESCLLKKAGCIMLAAVIAGAGNEGYKVTRVRREVPGLVVCTDSHLKPLSVEKNPVPLACGSKASKKVTTKKIKMKKKAAKTPSRIRRKTNKITKGRTASTRKISAKNTAPAAVTPLRPADKSIRSLASKADSRVLEAFEKMHGEVKTNASAACSGCFDAETMTITLKMINATLYHELGHFVEFCGGTSSAEQKITEAYNQEKSRYTGYNRIYVLQNSSEYFAEAFKNYCENPEKLKRERPKTCAAVLEAVNNITDSRIKILLTVYGSLWRK